MDVDDLNTTMNPGATCFAEAAYIRPHEYTWCQAHPGSLTSLTISLTVSYQVRLRGIPDAERQSSPAVSPDAVAAGNVIGADQ